MVKKRRGDGGMESLSERDRAVGRNLNRGGRNILGELVNMGEGRSEEIVLETAGDLDSMVSPIASGIMEEDSVLFTEE